MNISLTKKIIFTLLCLNFIISGTFYLSKSLDSISKMKVDDSGISGGGDDFEAFFSETHAIGYYHPVWKKRKVKYNVNLGFEYMKNDNFNFISFYTMLNYEPIKEFTASFLVGLNFYNHEYEIPNSLDYYPDSKGGQIYGLLLTYNTRKKISISLNYKIYTFSQVSYDIWADVKYSRSAISLGYKF